MVDILFARLVNSLLAPLNLKSWLIAGILLIIYGTLAIPLGLKTNFLSFTPNFLTREGIFGSIRVFFFPALGEEILMRVFLLPHPTERALLTSWLIWAGISVFIFIIYHPLNALTFYKRGNPTFLQPVFLTLAGLLGLICVIAYYFTGSLLMITLIHWLVVVVWLFIFDGKQKLNSSINILHSEE